MHSPALKNWTKEDYAFWGLCECCGCPLHSEPLRRRRKQTKRQSHCTGHETKQHNTSTEAVEYDVEAILKWIDGEKKHRVKPRKPERKKKSTSTSDLELNRFAQVLVAQKNQSLRTSICPEGKAKIIELCIQKLKSGNV